ncbi:hypothetical protein vseg_019960 [Gypsophila vaccaria]
MEKTEEEQQEEQQIIWSWGAGTEGQLCTSTLNDENTPELLHNNSLSSCAPISHLSCGGAHVIALTSGGKAITWGRGASGQLGNGQIGPNCLNPKLVDSLSSYNVCHVSAGWNHSGFVSDSGRLFTCGDGSFGQLGHGDYQSYSSPVEVSLFNSKHVEQVACGMRHTLVLTKGDFGDQLYGFGSNKRGQLGVSKEKIRSVNVPQPCIGFESALLVTVIANGDHSAAISADGHLFTWGRSFSGQSNVCVPELLSSSLSFKEAALGWNHALLLTGDGEVSMLGGSRHGALGEPERIAQGQHVSDSGNSPLRKVPGLDGKKVVQIATGAEHSAVVTGDGEIYTWGWGEHGQLGLGNTSDQTSPQLVDLQNVNSRNSLMLRVYCGSGFTFVVGTERGLSNKQLHEDGSVQ